MAQFNQKQGPWVWKDTYIFVEDCDKKVQAAHPIEPELVGTDFVSLKDTKGNTAAGASLAGQTALPGKRSSFIAGGGAAATPVASPW
ncbi:MAG: hypothetical protein WCA97_14270 [Terriglobales bacterium]